MREVSPTVTEGETAPQSAYADSSPDKWSHLTLTYIQR